MGWDVAGLDAEHVVASLSQGGLDVADQQLVVAVPAVEFAEQRVQPVRALVGLNGDIPQDKLDVGQAQARTTEQADELPEGGASVEFDDQGALMPKVVTRPARPSLVTCTARLAGARRSQPLSVRRVRSAAPRAPDR